MPPFGSRCRMSVRAFCPTLVRRPQPRVLQVIPSVQLRTVAAFRCEKCAPCNQASVAILLSAYKPAVQRSVLSQTGTKRVTAAGCGGPVREVGAFWHAPSLERSRTPGEHTVRLLRHAGYARLLWLGTVPSHNNLSWKRVAVSMGTLMSSSGLRRRRPSPWPGALPDC